MSRTKKRDKCHNIYSSKSFSMTSSSSLQYRFQERCWNVDMAEDRGPFQWHRPTRIARWAINIRAGPTFTQHISKKHSLASHPSNSSQIESVSLQIRYIPRLKDRPSIISSSPDANKEATGNSIRHIPCRFTGRAGEFVLRGMGSQSNVAAEFLPELLQPYTFEMRSSRDRIEQMA